jgi:hypothetical protein
MGHSCAPVGWLVRELTIPFAGQAPISYEHFGDVAGCAQRGSRLLSRAELVDWRWDRPVT